MNEDHYIPTKISPGGMEYEPLLTPKETARILSINTRTLANYAKDGKIDSVRSVSGHRRFPASAVMAAYEGRWEDAKPKDNGDSEEDDE